MSHRAVFNFGFVTTTTMIMVFDGTDNLPIFAIVLAVFNWGYLMGRADK